ncbi:MAG: hypothetical protein ACLQGV_03895 [Bryobacteraceae bacterium]
MTKRFIAALTLCAVPALAAPTCDRACLVAIVDQYLAALVKHDPSGLPLAAPFKFTENTATIPLGDGLWVGASAGPATFKIYAADPTWGQAGFFGVVQEFDKPVLLALRLKVEDGKIREIEHVVARYLGPLGAAGLVTPRPGLVQPVPPAERVSRQRMLSIADSYFDSIERTNSRLAPFAPDCERHENGVQTTTNKTPHPGADPASAAIDALNCGDQIDTRNLSYITRIRPRRLLIVDEEYGLVFAFPMFVHRGDVRSIRIVGVPGVTTIPRPFGPINLQAGEIFKIRGGQLHEIEANGFLLPYGAANGWE